VGKKREGEKREKIFSSNKVSCEITARTRQGRFLSLDKSMQRLLPPSHHSSFSTLVVKHYGPNDLSIATLHLPFLLRDAMTRIIGSAHLF